MKKIVLGLGLLVIVCIIGLHYVFAEKSIHDYDIFFNTSENKGIFEDEKDTITSIDAYVDGTKIQGFAEVTTCNMGSKYSTGCDMVLILQNEKIIQQNEEIVQLLREIAK